MLLSLPHGVDYGTPLLSSLIPHTHSCISLMPSLHTSPGEKWSGGEVEFFLFPKSVKNQWDYIALLGYPYLFWVRLVQNVARLHREEHGLAQPGSSDHFFLMRGWSLGSSMHHCAIVYCKPRKGYLVLIGSFSSCQLIPRSGYSLGMRLGINPTFFIPFLTACSIVWLFQSVPALQKTGKRDRVHSRIGNSSSSEKLPTCYPIGPLQKSTYIHAYIHKSQKSFPNENKHM